MTDNLDRLDERQLICRDIGTAWLLFCAIAAFLLFAVWSFALPVFESPDEPQHWLNARYIHDHLRLPPYNATYYEGNQAPLYYIVMAPFAFPDSGPPLAPCGPRQYLHCSAEVAKYWPIRFVRLLTALLSTGTVLLTILAGFAATRKIHLAFLAGAFVVCLPQFSVRGSSISNDAMVTACSAAATYFLVRFLQTCHWRMAWWCSVACGLALLSKLNAAMFPVVLAGAVLTAPAPWKVRISRLQLLLLAVAIILPWLIRNWFLYGDPTGEAAMLTTIPGLVNPQSIRSLYFRTTFLQMVFQSFVGVFGWMTLYMTDRIYRIYAAVAAAGGLGLLYGLIRRKFKPRVVIGLFAVMMLCALLLVRLNLTFPQPQGRLLFPALPAFAVLLAMGFGALPKWNRICSVAVAAGVAALNLYVLTSLILPAFWQPSVPKEYVDIWVPDSLMKGPAPVLSPGHRFTQSFISQHNHLYAVEVEVSNYMKRPRQGTIHMTLREGGIDAAPIAAVDIPANSIKNCCLYARLQFKPISGSAGKLYYVSLETEKILDDDKVTVFLSDHVVYPPGRFYLDGGPMEKDTTFITFFLEPPALCPVCGVR
jgi:4-amino-4-deoxy-L-arabinose transferase-like glycosyltransferase